MLPDVIRSEKINKMSYCLITLIVKHSVLHTVAGNYIHMDKGFRCAVIVVVSYCLLV